MTKYTLGVITKLKSRFLIIKENNERRVDFVGEKGIYMLIY